MTLHLIKFLQYLFWKFSTVTQHISLARLMEWSILLWWNSHTIFLRQTYCTLGRFLVNRRVLKVTLRYTSFVGVYSYVVGNVIYDGDILNSFMYVRKYRGWYSLFALLDLYFILSCLLFCSLQCHISSLIILTHHHFVSNIISASCNNDLAFIKWLMSIFHWQGKSFNENFFHTISALLVESAFHVSIRSCAHSKLTGRIQNNSKDENGDALRFYQNHQYTQKRTRRI